MNVSGRFFARSRYVSCLIPQLLGLWACNGVGDATPTTGHGTTPARSASTLIAEAPVTKIPREGKRRADPLPEHGRPRLANGRPSELDTAISKAGAVIRLHPGCGRSHAIALANGSDLTQEPVTLFSFGDGHGVEEMPGWLSDDYGYHSGVCVGDLDGDKRDDLVVTVLGSKAGEPDRGGVKVYYGMKSCPPNIDGRRVLPIETKPNWLAANMAAADCAVQDVDADGRADVVVAAMWAPSEAAPDQRLRLPALGRPDPRRLLRFPQNGRIVVLSNPGPGKAPPSQTRPLGIPEEASCKDKAFAPNVLHLANVNADKIPDIIAGGNRIAIWYGQGDGTGPVSYKGKPDWTSTEEFAYVGSLDAQYMPQLGRVGVLATRSCFSPDQLCCEGFGKSGYFLYDPEGPTKERTAIWQHELPKGTYAAASKLVPAGGNEPTELLVSLAYDAAKPSSFGSTLRVFAGQSDPAQPFEKVEVEWNAPFQTVVGDFELVRVFPNSRCDDLLVVSTNPSVASTMFAGAANCTN